ncbi:MAG: NAD(P)H-hydrate dehydratase [Candidatus Hadarchaeales archaeon]
MVLKYVTKAMVRKVLPHRRPDSHKGENGRVLVVGGSSRYVGAPALAALSALRSGVDLATVASPRETAKLINTFSPDLITVKLPCEDLTPEALPHLFPELEKCDTLILGPGLGGLEETRKAVLSLLEEVRREHPDLPVLLDADALKAVRGKEWRGMKVVLTPHAGEFKAVTEREVPKDLEGRAKTVGEEARRLGCVILLKGRIDLISSPEGKVFLNRTGNPGMTVGGTGDVLSGVVGGLMAQGLSPFEAAWAGAYVNGAAGDLCLREKGYGFTASDLIDKLPLVFKTLREG